MTNFCPHKMKLFEYKRIIVLILTTIYTLPSHLAFSGVYNYKNEGIKTHWTCTYQDVPSINMLCLSTCFIGKIYENTTQEDNKLSYSNFEIWPEMEKIYFSLFSSKNGMMNGIQIKSSVNSYWLVCMKLK